MHQQKPRTLRLENQLPAVMLRKTPAYSLALFTSVASVTRHRRRQGLGFLLCAQQLNRVLRDRRRPVTLHGIDRSKGGNPSIQIHMDGGGKAVHPARVAQNFMPVQNIDGNAVTVRGSWG